MRVSCSFLLIFSAYCLHTPAQMPASNSEPQPVITSDTPVNTAQLREWLHSGDPRLVAWAADFANRNNDSEILQSLPAFLERRALTAPYPSPDADGPQRWAVTAVLDVLLQRNIAVPVSTIRIVEQDFPAQAAMLISRVPLSDAKGDLNLWSVGKGAARANPMLARVAAMMLAKEPEPAFVARILREAEAELTIEVHREGVGLGGYGTASCGDWVGRGRPAGWPSIYTYHLADKESGLTPTSIVELDADRIVAFRTDAFGGWGSCGEEVESLDARARHRLIAHWLGVADSGMSWQAYESESIVWRDQADYQKQLGAIIAAHLGKLKITADSLRQLGLLQKDDGIDPTPRLNVKIACEIDPCPLKP